MKITPENSSVLQAMERTQEVVEAQGEVSCNWAYHEYEDYWTTDCGNLFGFNEGTPSENSFRYCPYCGRTLSETTAVED